uniref:Uncharacterized protein n=1 Tax=Mycena chlorophos TaxID=658473 RepID=A0ABQ0KTS4_MYCCL|nr:predicted protein [Mycena chlorophos]
MYPTSGMRRAIAAHSSNQVRRRLSLVIHLLTVAPATSNAGYQGGGDRAATSPGQARQILLFAHGGYRIGTYGRELRNVAGCDREPGMSDGGRGMPVPCRCEDVRQGWVEHEQSLRSASPLFFSGQLRV